jgi:RHS repeat-associated protein
VMTREIVWLNDVPIAIMMPSGTATNLFYIDSDHLNTPRTITNQSKQKRWEWNSDPFGTTPANEHPAGLGAFTFNLRFPGQYFDKETGLHYNYFRDYNPAIGRYVQSDPIGLAGGLNTFGYAGGRPVTSIDPYGLWEVADLFPKDAPIVTLGRAYAGVAAYAVGVVSGDDALAAAAAEGLADSREQNVEVGVMVMTLGRSRGQGETCPPSTGTGITAANGTQVTGFTRHGINRAIGNGGDRAGTRPHALLDSLKNPKKITDGIDSKGRPFQVFHGQNARVVVNPQTGQVVSANPLSRAGAQ